MTVDTACSRLAALLAEEKELAGRLFTVLEQENQAVVGRESERLHQVVAEKEALLAQLEGCHTQRMGLLAPAGHPVDRAGLIAFVAKCDGGKGELTRLWDALGEHIAACQQQNQLNGRLLEGSRRSVQQALSILLGGQGDDEAELYNQKGQAAPGGRGGYTSTKA